MLVAPKSGQIQPTPVQDWSAYTPEHHAVWATLYRRRMETLRSTGSMVFLRGIDAIGLSEDRVPDLARVNQRLSGLTGWAAVPVGGFLPAPEFFEQLALRRFPTTIAIRPTEQLDYLPEPDIFHDVFGHVPLHADPVFADFLARVGGLAESARDEDHIRHLARFFWFTVEFGLIREHGHTKIYGSGLISSIADAEHALGPHCDRRPFSLDAVLRQHFEIDRLQKLLFVIGSFDDLFAAVEELSRRTR